MRAIFNGKKKSKMKTVKNSRKGFTLAEGLMAMTILSFAAGGVLLPFSGGAAVRVEAARITLASKLASDMLEEIGKDDFINIPAWNGYRELDGNLQDFQDGYLNDDIYNGFSLKVTVRDDAYIGSITNYWVTVEVFRNGNKIVELSRLFGDS